jgi:chromosomal replication initiation ATPase DnaA
METYVITGELALEFKAFLAAKFRTIEISTPNQLPGLPLVKTNSIMQLVSSRYLAGANTLTSRCNVHDVVHARQIAMYLCRKLCQLGTLFGGKHHTTVQYAVEQITYKIQSDPAFKAEIEALEVDLLDGETA